MELSFERITLTIKAVSAPINCDIVKPIMLVGAMPEKLLVNDRAIVTAGLAKEVDAVNQ